MRNILLHAPSFGCQIFLLCSDSFDISVLPDNVERISIGTDLSNPYKRALWENLKLGKLAQSLDAGLLFCPGGLLPTYGLPPKLRTAVTFQNMLPFDIEQRSRYPMGGRRIRDWLLERGLASSIQRADLVIFISNFAERFIRSYVGSLKGHSVIIPHGIDRRFFKDISEENYRTEPGHADEYYLYVSYIDFYKSQIEVVQAFAKLKQENLLPGKLFLVGGGYPPYEAALRREVFRLGLDHSVIFKGNIPHEQLPEFYQNARINIFASRTENCPNILMEIMASGRPALVSNCGPMPEFAGDTVQYFDPTDVKSLIFSWRFMLQHWSDMENKARAAQNQIMGSTWNEASRITWKAIADAAKK